MPSRGIRDKVAVVGMGCTRFGEHWNASADDLMLEAALAACTSAGMAADAVDAHWLSTLASGSSGLMLSRALRLPYRPVTRVENYCAGGSDALRNACYAVASGAYDTALAVGVEKLKDSGTSGLAAAEVPGDGTRPDLTAPAAFSLVAQAYGERYRPPSGALREALDRIAWKNHANGALNPRAHFRRAVPLDTIRAAPRVAGELGLFDCSGVSDGAAAALVVRAEDAYRYTDKPLFVKALALAAGPAAGPADPGYDFTSFPEVRHSAADAYRQAGISDPRTELALAEVHDCFTITELVLMEDLGFAEPGTAWRSVLAGEFDRDGVLPVNTDGGLKAFGHPIGASGLRMLFECWLQLRGETPEGAALTGNTAHRKLALTHNLGGGPGECLSFVSIVGSEPSE
ncbi:acetyl-CoA acetyltransferase [Streptomyces sp. NPDC044571]|uniref:acetyl-CoA acetyltransferase n=1 Tax=Streptomyces sp. NPDC044571 TaxID=3155371 RepID=UPI0033C58DE4